MEHLLLLELRPVDLQRLDCVICGRYGQSSDRQVRAAQKAAYYARVDHEYEDLRARDPQDPVVRRLGIELQVTPLRNHEACRPAPTPRRRERVEELLPGTNATYLNVLWKILLANTSVADCVRAQRSLLKSCPEFHSVYAFLEGMGTAKESVFATLSGFSPIAICVAEIRYALHLDERLHAFRFARLVIQQLFYLALSSYVRAAAEPLAETVHKTVLQRIDDGTHVIGADVSVLLREFDALRHKLGEVSRIAGVGSPRQLWLRDGLVMELFASHIQELADPAGVEPSGLFCTLKPRQTRRWEETGATPSALGRLPTNSHAGD